MTEQAAEAARALREIALIKERAAGFQDYQAESRQLVLWGAAHMIGFGLTTLAPEWFLLTWSSVLLLAMGIGARLAQLSNAVVPGITWRYLLVVGSILLFALLINYLFHPLPPRQGALAGPLFIGCLYLIRGAHFRPRYIVLGVVLISVCFFGYQFLDTWFWWWMSIAFGGSLLLFGLWLRRY